MNIQISGSSGYLGTSILEKLKENGHNIKGIQRGLLYGALEDLKNSIIDADVIINLAGAPVLQRWTDENKKVIYNSRVQTTTNLVQAINETGPESRPKKLISASAIGIYEPGKTHDETSKDFTSEFIGKVVQDWEKATDDLNSGVQKVIFRMAPVIGRESQMIKQMKLPFKMGVGGKIGSGKQPFPFVHIDDVINAYVWAVERYSENNLFNLSAPDTVNNEEFTNVFAGKLNRPSFFKVPGFALKIMFGEAAITLLESPEVKPRKLQEAGFKFKYPDADSALTEILQKSPA